MNRSSTKHGRRTDPCEGGQIAQRNLTSSRGGKIASVQKPARRGWLKDLQLSCLLVLLALVVSTSAVKKKKKKSWFGGLFSSKKEDTISLSKEAHATLMEQITLAGRYRNACMKICEGKANALEISRDMLADGDQDYKTFEKSRREKQSKENKSEIKPQDKTQAEEDEKTRNALLLRYEHQKEIDKLFKKVQDLQNQVSELEANAAASEKAANLAKQQSMKRCGHTSKYRAACKAMALQLGIDCVNADDADKISRALNGKKLLKNGIVEQQAYKEWYLQLGYTAEQAKALPGIIRDDNTCNLLEGGCVYEEVQSVRSTARGRF